MNNGDPRNFPERSRQPRPSRRPPTEQPRIWRALPYMDGVLEAVSRFLRPLGIGIAHWPESTIRLLVMRPKASLPRGEITNFIYRIQCNFCAVNYIRETGKRLQTRVGEHMRALRTMDPFSLVLEHCADSGHTFAFQNAEILGRGNDRVISETIDTWHMEPTSINRYVALPAAYQALRAQLIERKSEHGIRPNVNSTAREPRTDMHLTTPQFGADEGAVMITATSITTPTDEETCNQDTNMIIDPGRQLRSMRTQTIAAPLNERHVN
ncbi:unnamed protein product [Schistocephalus solidus]|uniref:C2H2-type domain-containing protein n=1 Tax=Schistocephalus solidus TaxID=70667 RepID=A0A183T6Q1_SCHSO|nr:unnamed protein product [Schistocephalus solidus]